VTCIPLLVVLPLVGERWLVGAGGGLAGFYFFEEPDDADAEEA